MRSPTKAEKSFNESVNSLIRNEQSMKHYVNKLRWKYNNDYITEEEFYIKLESVAFSDEVSLTSHEWNELEKRIEINKTLKQKEKEEEDRKFKQKQKEKEELLEIVRYIFWGILIIVLLAGALFSRK